MYQSGNDKKEGAVKHIPIYFLFFFLKIHNGLVPIETVEALNRMWALIKHSNIRLENY
jgi:hypothetical protein